MIPEYEPIATGRRQSLFLADMEAHREELAGQLDGARVAVVGAAGSIGSAVVRLLADYRLGRLTLFDLSENNLVELVRELRSGSDTRLPEWFDALPIGMGSIEFRRFFEDSEPYDLFFNLAAIKHVRSEKDVYCIARMVDTNVVFLHEFIRRNPYRFRKVFSVSSDKAANPANLMGATKMAMECALMTTSDEQPFSTARFANVAFSDGSLPHGFLRRIEKKQPLSAPFDVRRYFISHREAAELCILAAALGENRSVFFPKMAAVKDEKTFSDIALGLLKHLGHEPVLCDSETEARNRAEELIRDAKWPCFFFKTDTSGEKPFEEFFVQGEDVDLARFENVGVIRRQAGGEGEAVSRFLEFAARAKQDRKVVKADYVRALTRLVPALGHIETGRNLDARM